MVLKYAPIFEMIIEVAVQLLLKEIPANHFCLCKLKWSLVVQFIWCPSLQKTDDKGVDATSDEYGSRFYSDDMVYKPSHFIGSVRDLLKKISPELQVTHVRYWTIRKTFVYNAICKQMLVALVGI